MLFFFMSRVTSRCFFCQQRVFGFLLLSFCCFTKADLPPTHIQILAATSQLQPSLMQQIRKVLSEKGYQTSLVGYQYEPKRSPFGQLTHSDEQRYHHFKRTVFQKGKILWAARGGYGAQSVLRRWSHDGVSDRTELPKKLLIGYSDITLIGLYFNHFYGWPYLQGVVLKYNADLFPFHSSGVNKSTLLQSILTILDGKQASLTYSLVPLNTAARHTTLVSGPVLGGNASVIQRNSNGLLKEIDWKNCLLFLEDVGEEAMKLRDILEGLFDSGKFHHINALILGNFSLNEKSQKELFDLIVQYVATYLSADIPIYHQPTFGHGERNNPLPMNQPSQIVLDQNNVPQLTIELSAINQFLKEAQ